MVDYYHLFIPLKKYYLYCYLQFINLIIRILLLREKLKNSFYLYLKIIKFFNNFSFYKIIKKFKNKIFQKNKKKINYYLL